MIELLELRLDGWLSYPKTKIPLNEPGITAILGPIGAGKSAILEAVFYLLFGKTLRSKDTVSDLVNKVLNTGYDISIDVLIDGVQVTIQEIRERKNHGLYFTKNGKDSRGKSDPETRKNIIATLGMTAEDFRAIAFLGQRQTQQLVEGSPADRAKALVEIFSLNRYDEMISACNDDIKDMEKEKDALSDTLSRETAELESLEASFVEVSVVEDTTDMEAELKEITVKIKKYEERIDTLIEASKITHRLIGELTQKRKNTEKVNGIKKEIVELKKELVKYNDTSQNTEELLSKINKLEKSAAVLEHTIEVAENKLRKAKCISNECPINNEQCPVNIPNRYKNKIIKDNHIALQESSSKLNDIAKKIEVRKNILTTCTERDNLSTKLQERLNLLNGLDTEDVNDAILEVKQQELQQLNDRIARGKAKTDELHNKKLTLSNEISRINSSSNIKEKIRVAIKNKKITVNSVKKDIDQKTEEVQYLAAAVSVFKKMKLYKIDVVLETLNENMQEILDKISDGEYKAEFTSQKLTADKKKMIDKVGITVYDTYKAMPIELWSGGQSTEVGLAVLLSTWKTANALSQKGVSSLWLDEVFGPLDEDIVDRVFDAVSDVAEQIGATSIKVITHRDLDARLFDNVWHARLENGLTVLETGND